MLQQVNVARTFLYLSTLICVSAMAKLSGLHSDELHSGELVLPRRVNADGVFVSHNLTYYHKQDHRHKRRRRSIEDDDEESPRHHHNHHRQQKQHHHHDADNDDSSDEADNKQHRGKKKMKMVHYALALSNETLHLELIPHTYFITPQMIIERHRRDLRTRKTPSTSSSFGSAGKIDVDCHFHGKVRGHANSNVALSACNGLVGHIKTQNNEYFIEPSKYHKAHATSGHPHVVFQRSSVKEKNQLNYNKKRKHHKHKQSHKQLHVQQQQQQQHQQYHQARVSNCGTKEPRRRIETRLEWQPRGKVKIQGGRQIRRQHQQQQQQGQHHQHHYNHHYHHHHQDKPVREELQLQETKAFRYQTEKSSQHNNDNNYNNNNDNDDNEFEERKWSLDGRAKEFASLSILNHQQPNNAGETNSMPTSTALTTQPTSASSLPSSASSSSSLPSLSSSSSSSSFLYTNEAFNAIQQQRIKRSISSPRHVETLLVADATMVAFHGPEIETYLLTIMNMVSALYKDPSIGNSIEIVVVKIILLEEDEAHLDLNLTQNAQRNLDRFCNWQHKLNTNSENDPHHHDVAILVTRKNICGNNCMTLGLANVGGMCKPKQSCSVNEDNGIMLSHTITHELGHNFGMFHDTAKIGCHPRVGSIVHIMTPTFGADTLQVCWSNCSRKYITHFLDQGLGDCLDDSPTPHEIYNYPEILPGELFNAERQCRMQFNVTDETTDVGICSAPHELCSTLWCRVNGECVTNMRPTAPGTSCGKRKWCQNGKCVRMEELTPINGGWGNWSEWSECSRSCGGGVSTQQRECNNPVPANGGVFCIGERKRYKICKKKYCAEHEPSFRAIQCTNYNNVTYQGVLYKWQPFFDKNNPCKLMCTDEDDTIIANWGDTVLDGTPCTLGTNNMCIDGICKKVGCDWIVDSDMQEDRCGICGGNGDQCKPVKEVYSESFNITEGYIEIVKIPAKARHIIIRELANTENFLGVARSNSDHFYLNGDNLISMPGEFEIAGAKSLYDRLDEQETIKIPQPIQHSITLYAIVRVNETNEGIYYEFTLPATSANGSTTNSKQYLWRLSNWSNCTLLCGSGLQYREAVCFENGKLIPDNVPCWMHAKNKRPIHQTRLCNQQICAAHWWTGPWQFCPVTCKQVDMPHPVKRRSVMCLDEHDIVVLDAQCSNLPRPPETEYCDQHLPDCKMH